MTLKKPVKALKSHPQVKNQQMKKLRNVENMSQEEAQSYYPQAVNILQQSGNIEKMLEFLAKMQKFQYKPAVQLMLKLELEHQLEQFIEIVKRYILFIFVQQQIDESDREFLGNICKAAIENGLFKPVARGQINGKYLDMPEKTLVNELFWERIKLHQKAELVSALYYKLNETAADGTTAQTQRPASSGNAERTETGEAE